MNILISQRAVVRKGCIVLAAGPWLTLSTHGDFLGRDDIAKYTWVKVTIAPCLDVEMIGGIQKGNIFRM